MTTAGLAALQRDIPMYSPERRYRKLLASLRMAPARASRPSSSRRCRSPRWTCCSSARWPRASSRPASSPRCSTRSDADGAFRARPARGRRLGTRRSIAALRPGQALRRRRHRAAHRAGCSTTTPTGRATAATRAPPGELTRIVTELDRLGFQTHTHATGDGGIRLALDAIEHAAARNGTRDRRHGVVHVECLHPDDLPRFARARRDGRDAAAPLLPRPRRRHLDGQHRRAALGPRLALPLPHRVRCPRRALERLAGRRNGPTGRHLLGADPGAASTAARRGLRAERLGLDAALRGLHGRGRLGVARRGLPRRRARGRSRRPCRPGRRTSTTTSPTPPRCSSSAPTSRSSPANRSRRGGCGSSAGGAARRDAPLLRQSASI